MSVTTERTGVVFYAAGALLAYLVYQLFRPFLVPLAWAAVLTICFYPAHERFARHLSRGRAALVSTLSVALLVILPMLAVASAFVSEASRVVNDVPQVLTDVPASAQRWVHTALQHIPGGESLDLTALLADPARRLAAFLSARAAAVLQNVVVFVVDLAIMLFTLFFLFRDAPGVVAAARRAMPFAPDLRERLIEQTRSLVVASVASSLIVAAIQGLLGGLAFWLLGLSAPVFWGVLMAVLCLLPFGAWVVWAPAAVWLVVTGSVVRGIILVAVGAGVISAADNFLRPILLSEHSSLNGLLLFIGLLGGVIAFGSVGLVLGPVLMATAVALYEAFTADATTSPS